MYAYYELTTFNITVPKPLKKMITNMQVGPAFQDNQHNAIKRERYITRACGGCGVYFASSVSCGPAGGESENVCAKLAMLMCVS